MNYTNYLYFEYSFKPYGMLFCGE